MRSLKSRLEALEQTAIVVWQAEAARKAAIVPPPRRPSYDAVLAGIDRVLAGIADGQCQAVGTIQIAGTWYYTLRPWHATPAESEALYPWCNWMMSAMDSIPLDDRPRSTAAYAEWIMLNRELMARRAAYGENDEELS